MEKPKAKRNGLPFCHEEILYLLEINGGTMTRCDLRNTLFDMGYSFYGVYEALRRLKDRKLIVFNGPGQSPYQKISIKDG